MTTAAEARQGVIDLTTLSRRELHSTWRSFADLPPSELRDALMVALPAIAEVYGSAAGALAADWYDDERDRAGVRGRFTAEPADLPTMGRWESLVNMTLGRLLRLPEFRPLKDDATARQAVLTLIDGGLQRTVADQHRLTVVDNTKRDGQAKGWRRVGVGASCGFCRMLIDRGHVYTQAGATFKSHDHCNCYAAPAFTMTGAVSPVAYEQSKNRPRSDKARRRRNQAAYDYIRKHYGEDAL